MAGTAEGSARAAKPKGKPRGRPFQKGKSGNPGGAKKRTPEEFALIAACQAKTPEALQVMESIMRAGDSDQVRLKAAMAIVERGWGAPKQQVEHTGLNGGPIQTETRTGPLEPDQAYRDLMQHGSGDGAVH